jgi:hypothetical protein
MVRHSTLSIVFLTLAFSGVATAQTPTGSGSLTVMSRPSGASFRLVGEQVIMARTPIVLERGLSGRYRLESTEPAYNRWHRTLNLNGAIGDSVWMTLSRKTAAAAAVRSLVIPGWGQGYSARPTASAVWLTTGILAGGAAGTLEYLYQRRKSDLDDAQKLAVSSPTSANLAARQTTSDRLDDARRWRGIAIVAVGAVWGLNFIDSIVGFPQIRAGQMSFEVLPVPERDPRALALVRARF